MSEVEYLRSDLCGLFGIDCADVLIMFQRVLSVLLLCTHILLQQTQHLTGLVVTALYGFTGVITLRYSLLKQMCCFWLFFIYT